MQEAKHIKPKIIAFEVTRRCRFACRHCRAGTGYSEGEKGLTTGQCKKILKSIADFAKPMIIFTGGEPMERGDIYKLIEYGQGLGLRMVMATCGYLIDEVSMAKLKKVGIKALSFSLDGSSAESHDLFRGSAGAFDAVIKAAELAREAKVRFQINTTISKINLDEVSGIVELARRLGAYCFDAFILVPTGRGRQIVEAILDPVEYESFLNDLARLKLDSKIEVRVTCGPQFARVYRQAKAEKIIGNVNGCIGGRAFGFVSYKGDVQICGFLDKSTGNLIENNYNFAKIWLESDLLQQIRDLPAYTGRCKNCDYLGVCGGCRARAFAMSGDYLGTDPVCTYVPKAKQ